MYLNETVWVYERVYDIHLIIHYLDKRQPIGLGGRLWFRILCILTLSRGNVSFSFVKNRGIDSCVGTKIYQLVMLGQNITQLVGVCWIKDNQLAVLCWKGRNQYNQRVQMFNIIPSTWHVT